MTRPSERTRALRFGVEFLLDLQASEHVTPDQRVTVDKLLLHYPMSSEIFKWASEVGDLPFAMLQPEDDPRDEVTFPEEQSRPPVSALDRAASIIESGRFFRSLSSSDLHLSLSFQLPYVLRQFPDTGEIKAISSSF